MAIEASPHPAGPFARLRNLQPIFIFLAALAILDQSILFLGLARIGTMSASEGTIAWQRPFRAAAQAVEADRPLAVVVGSSRAEAIPQSYLEAAAREAGLSHQVFNLGVSFGTPSLILSGLTDLTPFMERWPAGSHLIYVFSAHEMGGLQPHKLVTSKSGRALLERHVSAAEIDRALNDVPVDEVRNPGLRSIYHYSGLAQVMTKAALVMPSWLVRLREIRGLPAINIVKPAKMQISPDCRGSFSLHPANVEALEALAARFGPSLSVVFPPRHPISLQCSTETDRTAAAYVARLLARHGGTLSADPERTMPLPADDFIYDPEHIITDNGRRVVATALMRMVR